MEDEKFRQELDELFKLFNKLMERSDMDNIPGVNKFMLQQFQGQFGDSVKDMVHQLVEQLRNEVGDDDELFQPSTSVDIHVTPVAEPSKTETLEELDEMLKNPNLTPEEIDNLLDRRMKLANG